jgi:HD domain-containing protein
VARLSLRAGLPPILGRVSADLQEAFQKDLAAYTDVIRHRRGSLGGSKVINDPVWRTVRIEAWEVVVLDSPLVQRLRGIRQLGLAGLVFPSASYSRFEHSIGTLHQTQRFLDALNRSARARAARRNAPVLEPILRTDETALRLAALLHDTGHGFLSHVSERAMARLPELPGSGTVEELGSLPATTFDVAEAFRHLRRFYPRCLCYCLSSLKSLRAPVCQHGSPTNLQTS